PNSPSADPVKMAEELLNGYQWFIKALPMDSVPNEKGEIKPKYSKDIVGKLAGHTVDYFTGGGAMWEAKRYYPEAYQCFMIYGDMPDLAFLGNKAPKLEAADRAQAYYNAGIAAYSGNAVPEAANAFHKARIAGSDDPNVYIYELACWQNIAQNDSTQGAVAEKNIYEIAKAGYDKFGLEQPVFLNNLVNTYVLAEDYESALATINNLLATNPDSANLYGLRGFVYDRCNEDQKSIDDYLKAVSYEDCDFENLKNAAKKLLRVGATKINEVAANDTNGKLQVRNTYYEPALKIANRAKEMNANDSDLEYVLENINYAIDTYFPANR
ncbi:MAG: hypothetical protein K2K29_06640, partial [Muribaculaceae bacterium]|nr:hypothetical protein [Muribaculaceae bacterium]